MWSGKYEDPGLETCLRDTREALSSASPCIQAASALDSSLEKTASRLFHSASGRRKGGICPCPATWGALPENTYPTDVPTGPKCCEVLLACYEKSYFPTFIHSFLPIPRSMNNTLMLWMCWGMTVCTSQNWPGILSFAYFVVRKKAVASAQTGCSDFYSPGSPC